MKALAILRGSTWPRANLTFRPHLHLRWELSYLSLERAWLTVLCLGGWPGPCKARALWQSLAGVRKNRNNCGNDGSPPLSSHLLRCSALYNLSSVTRPRDMSTLILPPDRTTEAWGGDGGTRIQFQAAWLQSTLIPLKGLTRVPPLLVLHPSRQQEPRGTKEQPLSLRCSPPSAEKTVTRWTEDVPLAELLLRARLCRVQAWHHTAWV